jgi:hypothetical protein
MATFHVRIAPGFNVCSRIASASAQTCRRTAHRFRDIGELAGVDDNAARGRRHHG